MKGSPAMIDALNTVYRLLLAIEQQGHVQEHLLESTGWKCLSDWWDCVESKAHKRLIHPLMSRINDLGGRVDSRYAFEPECFPAEQLEAALKSLAGRLNALRDAYVEVCEAAEAVDDYVTEDMVWGALEWVEKQGRKFNNRLAKLRAVGLNAFLAEKMG